MSEITRWNLKDPYKECIVPVDDGKLVLYSDHAALQAKHAEEVETWRKAANYWWTAYYQATAGKVPQPSSSDPEQDRAARAMVQRERQHAEEVSRLREEVKRLAAIDPTGTIQAIEVERLRLNEVQMTRDEYNAETKRLTGE